MHIKRKSRFIVTGLLVFCLPPDAHCQSNGYIAVFTDPQETQPCMYVPPNTSATLFVLAFADGASKAGVMGAGFRVDVSSPAGWYIHYTPPANARTSGNPLQSGIEISFHDCQTPVVGRVMLGTISVLNLSGSTTDLIVAGDTTRTDSTLARPSLVLCDAPTFSRCPSYLPATAPTCSLASSKPQGAPGARSFVMTLSPQPKPMPANEPFTEILARSETELWVMGRRAEAESIHVVFDGTNIAVAGIPVPLLEGVKPSDEEHMAIYRRVPFIDARMRDGLTIEQAKQLFYSERSALYRLVQWAYDNSSFSRVGELLEMSPLVESVITDQQNHTVTVKYEGFDIIGGLAPGGPKIRHPSRE